MANKDLCRESHKINELNWWYELLDGIQIHSDEHTQVGHHLVLTITWGQIRAALARKDKKKE